MKTIPRGERAPILRALVLTSAMLLGWCATAHAVAPYPVGGDQGGAYGSGGDEQQSVPLAVGDRDRPSAEFGLRVRSPNPAASITIFEFDLPRPALLTVRLYDVLGREVARPATRLAFRAGTHQLQLSMESLASGSYLCRLLFETPGSGESRVLVRRITRIH
jgi:hypothetical protein